MVRAHPERRKHIFDVLTADTSAPAARCLHENTCSWARSHRSSAAHYCSSRTHHHGILAPEGARAAWGLGSRSNEGGEEKSTSGVRSRMEQILATGVSGCSPLLRTYTRRRSIFSNHGVFRSLLEDGDYSPASSAGWEASNER